VYTEHRLPRGAPLRNAASATARFASLGLIAPLF